eukprot:scaffold5063_cov127-Isochrysis_galbana.AAC.8
MPSKPGKPMLMTCFPVQGPAKPSPPAALAVWLVCPNGSFRGDSTSSPGPSAQSNVIRVESRWAPMRTPVTDG